MKQVTKYQNKKVIVVGLARSGMSAAKLLHRLGAFVTVNDLTPMEQNKEAQELEKMGMRVITGYHPESLLDEGFDYMFKNPGIPYENVMVQQAMNHHIPVLTEIELAYDILEADIIGVTGTNGKTTVVMMLETVMNTYRQHLGVLSGNIGFPASTVAQDVSKDQHLIMELSSFQLMGTKDFKPHVAAITNLFEAHLDYHHTRKAYIEAKFEIQKNMTSDDYLVLNIDQKEAQQLSEHTKATVVPTSYHHRVDGAYYRDDMLYFKDEAIMSSNDLGVPGTHNIYNALTVIAIAKLYHLPNEVIKKGLQSFKGASHRLQYVTEINDVTYYNDSKATNALATKSALSGFDRSRLVLILGGLDRGDDGELIASDLEGIKAIIAFGETKQKMEALAKSAQVPQVYSVDTIKEAVQTAYRIAQPKDYVLLSPAHASWDQYKTFEARGDDFMQCVNNLKG